MCRVLFMSFVSVVFVLGACSEESSSPSSEITETSASSGAMERSSAHPLDDDIAAFQELFRDRWSSIEFSRLKPEEEQAAPVVQVLQAAWINDEAMLRDAYTSQATMLAKEREIDWKQLMVYWSSACKELAHYLEEYEEPKDLVVSRDAEKKEETNNSARNHEEQAGSVDNLDISVYYNSKSDKVNIDLRNATGDWYTRVRQVDGEWKIDSLPQAVGKDIPQAKPFETAMQAAIDGDEETFLGAFSGELLTMFEGDASRAMEDTREELEMLYGGSLDDLYYSYDTDREREKDPLHVLGTNRFLNVVEVDGEWKLVR